MYHLAIPIGTGASGIPMDPGRPRVFVSCSPDKYVAVVELKTFSVVGHIDVGAQPDGLEWAYRS